jgi:hypothetical protein
MLLVTEQVAERLRGEGDTTKWPTQPRHRGKCPLELPPAEHDHAVQVRDLAARMLSPPSDRVQPVRAAEGESSRRSPVPAVATVRAYSVLSRARCRGQREDGSVRVDNRDGAADVVRSSLRPSGRRGGLRGNPSSRLRSGPATRRSGEGTGARADVPLPGMRRPLPVGEAHRVL